MEHDETSGADGRLEPVVGRVRIKTGATVSQDFKIGMWPATASGDDIDPDMEFDAEWRGSWWDCRADGYGRRSWYGERGGYGNGSIFVHDRNGVTLLTPNAQVKGDAEPKAQRSALQPVVGQDGG